MLIGSGLLAQAFTPISRYEDVCIYAAGVSNSSCSNLHEFARERQRLADSLWQARDVDIFVYFGTCSVADLEARNTPYVQHKLAMEQLVSAHSNYLILRLSQVVGRTPNPHTLMNFLYACIVRSEAFNLWRNAKRNIIDIDDVVSIASQLITNKAMRNITVNIANPVSYPIADIVRVMESVVGKRAIYEVVERGSGYPIDISTMLPVLGKAAVEFGDNYLMRVISKYYGKIG